MREFFTHTLSGFQKKDDFSEHIRAMRAACRKFLDTVQQKNGGLILRNSFEGGPNSWVFFSALGELRAAIGLHLGIIAVMFGLEIESDLATILPPKPTAKDD